MFVICFNYYIKPNYQGENEIKTRAVAMGLLKWYKRFSKKKMVLKVILNV